MATDSASQPLADNTTFQVHPAPAAMSVLQVNVELAVRKENRVVTVSAATSEFKVHPATCL